jgi:hypothetical protein
MKTTFSSILFTIALTVAAPAHAQSIDATGTWDVTFNTQNGPMAASLTIKKDGDKLAGTMTGPQGDVPIEGTQKDKLVALNLSVQTPNGPFAIAMSGTLEGDALAGTVDFGGRGQAEWAGRRRGAVAAASTTAPAQGEKQAEKVDVTGAWAFTIDTGGGTGTPSVTFKQDGEKLTGHYSSQVLGERDFTGTVKGNAIQFTFNAEAQGQQIDVAYSGTVDGNTMKGTVNMAGGQLTGSFTGKKQ